MSATSYGAPVTSSCHMCVESCKLLTTCHRRCRGAFIPFIVAGDPNMDATEQALLALDRAGADIIELGVPYSVRAHSDACN